VHPRPRSAAVIATGEHKLHVTGVFGDVEVRLPQGAAFRLSSSSLAGSIRCNDEKREGVGRSMQWESPEYERADRKLQIEVSHVFGDVKVSNR
jgi:lia operon protein LiaF